jgi:hypothetical protein
MSVVWRCDINRIDKPGAQQFPMAFKSSFRRKIQPISGSFKRRFAYVGDSGYLAVFVPQIFGDVGAVHYPSDADKTYAVFFHGCTFVYVLRYL